MCQQILENGLLVSWGPIVGIYGFKRKSVLPVWKVPSSNKTSRLLSTLVFKFLPARILYRRPGIRNAFCVDERYYIIFYDKIYKFDVKNKKEITILDFTKELIHAPLPGGCCYKNEGNIYFGEYQNTRPASIRIIKVDIYKAKWVIVYTFPLGQIKHIHSIIYDKWRRRYWITTGDNDKESGLYYSDDEFKTVICFGQGDQGWRMVSLVPLEDRLLWGTDVGKDIDASQAGNFIVQYRFDKAKREIIQKIMNPVYYTYCTPSGTIYFSMTVESRSDLTSNKVSIIKSTDGMTWDIVLELDYKKSKVKYGSAYGTIFFPHGMCLDETVYMTPINTYNHHGSLLSICRTT